MSANKRKGTAAESALVTFLRGHGWPFAERRALTGAKDRGDVTGTPYIAWEQKSAARICLPEWLRETETERVNAGADYGVLVVKLRGVGAANAGNWAAVMPLRQMTDLLRRAGYGDAPTERESA